LGFSDALSALGRGSMSNAAGIDNNQFGFVSGLNLDQAQPFEQLPNLLGFVLIDFTAEAVCGKSFHNMV
jgi:hypothetical protein